MDIASNKLLTFLLVLFIPFIQSDIAVISLVALAVSAFKFTKMDLSHLSTGKQLLWVATRVGFSVAVAFAVGGLTPVIHKIVPDVIGLSEHRVQIAVAAAVAYNWEFFEAVLTKFVKEKFKI